MREYSDSSRGGRPDRQPLTLAVDTGSPRASLALGLGSELLAEVSFSGGSESPSLLGEIDGLLHSVGRTVPSLDRLIGARGPGSFTGLRTGLAALLGLHQALGVPAAAVPSFRPLAAQGSPSGRVLAAVDAMRGEWYVQVFEAPDAPPVSAPVIVRPEAIRQWTPCRVVAFGSDRIAAALGDCDGLEILEATPLARGLLTLAGSRDLDWNPALLASPLYLRPPAVKR